MLPFALNHMTVPANIAGDMLAVAYDLGCVGVELRNDLSTEMFGRLGAEAFGARAKSANMRILALAEVEAFNDPTGDPVPDAIALVRDARLSGAEGIVLIPKVNDAPISCSDQRDALKQSLLRLMPVLESSGVVGLIEPLGFENSSLRYKDDVARVLDDMGRPACFGIIHDTFHHYLAQTDSIHADLTRIVHISGINDPKLNPSEMHDVHRVLIGPGDRLGSVAQLKTLMLAGYTGPASFEVFAPEIHDLTDPVTALSVSINFIAGQLVGEPA